MRARNCPKHATPEEGLACQRCRPGRLKRFVVALSIVTVPLIAQVPSNLVSEGAPAFTPELVAKTAPYFESRPAAFADWHPQRAEMLISTRFGDTAQLHLVKTGKRVGDELEILSGLQAGDAVVVEGAGQLTDGQPVVAK